MEKLKFYKYATWALLILNVTMVALFMFTKPPRPGGDNQGFKSNAIDVLKLDKDQHDAFLQYAKAHQEQMKQINEQQSNLLKPYFSSIVDSKSNLDFEKNLSEAQSLERKKIESTYAHFQEVKSILKKEQQADFKSFMEKAIKHILFEQNKKPPPPK